MYTELSIKKAFEKQIFSGCQNLLEHKSPSNFKMMATQDCKLVTFNSTN